MTAELRYPKMGVAMDESVCFYFGTTGNLEQLDRKRVSGRDTTAGQVCQRALPLESDRLAPGLRVLALFGRPTERDRVAAM
jgi:hypothetical protein